MTIPFSSTVAASCGLLLIVGCGTTATVTKTFDDPTYTDSSYANILVIGVAGDYGNRAAFELAIVSRIKGKDADAAAYYTVVGRNQPVTRNLVSNIIRARDFDAVLLTRLISQESEVSVKGGSPDTEITRKEAARAIDLFRYDYDELSDPASFTVSGPVMLSVEMFHVADERRMWAIESTISDVDNIDQIIEIAADTIVDALRKDSMIGR